MVILTKLSNYPKILTLYQMLTPRSTGDEWDHFDFYTGLSTSDLTNANLRGVTSADTILEGLGVDATFSNQNKNQNKPKSLPVNVILQKAILKQMCHISRKKKKSYKQNTLKNTIKSLIFKIWGKKILVNFF